MIEYQFCVKASGKIKLLRVLSFSYIAGLKVGIAVKADILQVLQPFFV